MTTREQAHKLLDELPDSEIEPIVELITSRAELKTEPDVVGLPDGWGETLTGEPMPNVVAAIHRSRSEH